MKKFVLFLIFLLSFILLNQQGFTLETENNEAAAKATFMAVFAKYDGIDGEAQDADHGGWTNVIRYQHLKAGPNRRLEIMKMVIRRDKSSPLLAQAFRNKRTFSTVMVDDVNTPSSYLRYELKNVMITSYQTGGTRNAPTVNVALNFEEIKVTYTENDAAGRPATDIRYTWKAKLPPPQP